VLFRLALILKNAPRASLSRVGAILLWTKGVLPQDVVAGLYHIVVRFVPLLLQGT
jgi:hypothetical protein